VEGTIETREMGEEHEAIPVLLQVLVSLFWMLVLLLLLPLLLLLLLLLLVVGPHRGAGRRKAWVPRLPNTLTARIAVKPIRKPPHDDDSDTDDDPSGLLLRLLPLLILAVDSSGGAAAVDAEAT